MRNNEILLSSSRRQINFFLDLITNDSKSNTYFWAILCIKMVFRILADWLAKKLQEKWKLPKLVAAYSLF